MKINADIVYQNLSKHMDVHLVGNSKKAPILKRIEFFDPAKQLRQNCIYIGLAGTYDTPPVTIDGLVFICVGGRPPQEYFEGKCTLLLLESNSDILSVFSAVQDIFDYYETWDDKLQNIVNATANIQEMIDISIPVFENPIYMIDHNLRFLAYTRIDADETGKILSHMVDSSINPVPVDLVKSMQKTLQQDKMRTEPYTNNDNLYCINLFVHNRYTGVIALGKSIHSLCDSDYVLFMHLAGLIQLALHKFTKIRSSSVDTMKTIINDLFEDSPVNESRLQQLSKNDMEGGRYVCLKFRLAEGDYGVPANYISETLEAMLPGCIAMEHDATIVAFLSLFDCPYSYEDALQILEQFLKDMNFQAGISNFFSDLRNVRFHLRQACCAIETGRRLNATHLYYSFSDYALQYMADSAVGELTPEFVCPPGLLRLKKYGDSSSVDYWNTLKVYLNNKMNATQTAKDLFLHRSTLLQRLTKIYSILDVDLSRPENRLHVELCVYLLDTLES